MSAETPDLEKNEIPIKQLESESEEFCVLDDAVVEKDEASPIKSTKRCTAKRFALYFCGSLVCLIIILICLMAIMANAVVVNNEDKWMQPPSSVKRKVESTVRTDFDPLVLNDNTTDSLGKINLGICASQVNVSYMIGTLTGLKSIDVQRLELVKGTGELHMAPLGWKGSSWVGTFLLNATFTDLAAEISADITAKDCGIPIPPVSGTAVVENTSVELVMYMAGESHSLFAMLRGDNQVNTADIKNLNFTFDGLKIQMSPFLGLIPLPQINFASKFGDMLMSQITDIVQPRMMQTLQAALNEELPYTA